MPLVQSTLEINFIWPSSLIACSGARCPHRCWWPTLRSPRLLPPSSPVHQVRVGKRFKAHYKPYCELKNSITTIYTQVPGKLLLEHPEVCQVDMSFTAFFDENRCEVTTPAADLRYRKGTLHTQHTLHLLGSADTASYHRPSRWSAGSNDWNIMGKLGASQYHQRLCELLQITLTAL